jgi:DNA-binding response OmpR family regulator
MCGRPSVILIIDDDPAIREILAILLEAEGYVVEEAEDADSGLARLARDGIDLVIVDMMLPGVDGLEFCRAVRGRSATADVPIVVVTASIDRSAREAALAAGADDFVAKPVDAAELYNRVRTCLERRCRLLAVAQQD